MANVSFTRDEVILALDVLYANGNQPMKPDSPTIVELSRLLNELPIVPKEKKTNNYRNVSGVRNQLDRYLRGYSDKHEYWNVGFLFFQVYEEYQDHMDELHAIANTIRKNVDFFISAAFGDEKEGDNFPEGALLSHLHRFLEVRDSQTIQKASRCEVCGIAIDDIYITYDDSYVQAHLTVPIVELNAKKKYRKTDFVYVCPNCHYALHHYRPWLLKDRCADVLR